MIGKYIIQSVRNIIKTDVGNGSFLSLLLAVQSIRQISFVISRITKHTADNTENLCPELILKFRTSKVFTRYENLLSLVHTYVRMLDNNAVHVFGRFFFFF
uniref:Uncharacterized protein n=1 Tax=Cacopsylla melanoneura TaxID=428564 RepID=A0A8D9BA38_9HEMI